MTVKWDTHAVVLSVKFLTILDPEELIQ